MAWQIALVMDAETNLNVATGEMPIWAQATPERQAFAPEARDSWNSLWYPDPGFTLIVAPTAHDLEQTSAGMLSTIEEHHPNLYCVHLFGVPKSERLDVAMAEAGYYPAQLNRNPGLTFVRPFEKFAKELALDATGWSLRSNWFWMQDFYSAFFYAVGAPEWHGRNFDALNDSIAGGGINKIEVPYRIVIRNAPRENEMVKGALAELADLIHHMQSKGCPVAFVVTDG